MSTENSEGIVLDANKSVEAQLQKAKEERAKKLKKQKIRKIIFLVGGIGIVVVGLLLYLIITSVVNNMPMTVTTVTPERGDLESTIMASGNIESDNVIHYYAPANVLVEDCVSLGDRVSAGDVLIAFDSEDYAFVLKEAELQNQITSNSYQSSLTQYEQNKKDLATARANIKKYQDLVNAQQAVVDEMTRTITDANAIKIADLNNQIYEAERAISDYQYCIANAQMLGMGQEGIEAYTRYAQEKSQLIASLRQEINLISGGATAYDQQKQLTNAQNLLSDYKMELEKAKSEAEALEAALGNEYDAENIVLNGELNTMRSQSAYDELAAYEEGLKAEFDGVVTVSSVEAGKETMAGTEMIALASSKDLKVRFSITKSGLENVAVGQRAVITILGTEYEGSITRVSSMAVSGANGGSGVEVEVSIDNPDDKIYLGLDAKVKLFTASRTDVLMLPVEAVNADKQGEFVYAVVDGIVVKKYVTTGISSDTNIEIVDGVEETDQIIAMASAGIEEGVPVMAMPAMNMEMMPEEGMEGAVTIEVGTVSEANMDEETMSAGVAEVMSAE